jgi:hypothetical protein
MAHCALALGALACEPARAQDGPDTDTLSTNATLALARDAIGTGSPGPSLARELDEPSEGAPAPRHGLPWSLDVTAQTSLPLAVGLELQLTTPIGITAHLAGGHTPSAYLNVIADVLHGAGVYGDELDPLIRDGIANGAWNVRAGLGFTIEEGLELAVGYTYLIAEAPLMAASIKTATGQSVDAYGVSSIPISLGLHALHGRLGWRAVIERYFVMRFALGWTHVFASDADIVMPEVLLDFDGAADRLEEIIAETVGKYGFTPEILVSAGVRI